MINSTLCELKSLTATTRFGHSVDKATMEIANDTAKVSIPWEHGIWDFSGSEAPISGTILLVEVDEDSPSELRLIGPVDRFYHLAKC